jgi:hypothetical protein
MKKEFGRRQSPSAYLRILSFPGSVTPIATNLYQRLIHQEIPIQTETSDF